MGSPKSRLESGRGIISRGPKNEKKAKTKLKNLVVIRWVALLRGSRRLEKSLRRKKVFERNVKGEGGVLGVV